MGVLHFLNSKINAQISSIDQEFGGQQARKLSIKNAKNQVAFYLENKRDLNTRIAVIEGKMQDVGDLLAANYSNSGYNEQA